ncbi:protein of unknown function [Methylorubrum extorquens DM4]|uniref:Uncharacterized protein n=1 Tax=Methylorubrum extorquens (strain DSM 6343 / CIP 106787 / DM4) TaxID=661410 RepID=C7CEU1_METED|nr:protein of unknown function [Methylorubrum extorquens DM4]
MQSDLYQVAGTLQGNRLTLYVDRSEDNERRGAKSRRPHAARPSRSRSSDGAMPRRAEARPKPAGSRHCSSPWDGTGSPVSLPFGWRGRPTCCRSSS